MSFLFKHESAQRAIWEAAFAAALPELEFRAWPEYGAPDEIRYLLFYKPIENLQQFTTSNWSSPPAPAPIRRSSSTCPRM